MFGRVETEQVNGRFVIEWQKTAINQRKIDFYSFHTSPIHYATQMVSFQMMNFDAENFRT
jgi:hypothetical protein